MLRSEIMLPVISSLILGIRIVQERGMKHFRNEDLDQQIQVYYGSLSNTRGVTSGFAQESVIFIRNPGVSRDVPFDLQGKESLVVAAQG